MQPNIQITMAERYKPTAEHIDLDNSVSYSEKDLKLAFESFIQEEPKQTNSAILNFPTIAGFLMLVVGMVFLVGQVFPSLVMDVSGLLRTLPVIGGILATFIGLGWFTRNKKKQKVKEARNPSFLSSSGSSTSSSAFTNSSSASMSSSNSSKNTNKSSSEFEAAYYDSYAFKRPRKLYKSVTDKKVSGVCGGLAAYLGVSSTFLRIVFIAATFMGWGSPILLYLGLSIILSKEPRIISENK